LAARETGFVALKLYNSRTRKKEEFRPLDPTNVRMYVCGPTVYDYAHIGNARPVIVFDVLFRLLRHLYGADHVTYVRNITDVDDKINARAAEEGVPIRELTERTLAQFHADVAVLGCLPPDVEPRATDHIEEMKAMIETLVEKGCAYVAEDHVLFHVTAMPDYGQLARRSLDEMQAGARVEVAPYKRDPMDFVLWKPSKDGEPGWPSPCGITVPGRPGWHIECSAMAEKHLGKIFDIHGGGIDLVFPHHENEVAQSRCAHGTDLMAQVWMHNGFLQVEGEKMSKSLGNFVTIHALFEGWRDFQWPREAIKLAMLSTHYKQPIDWTVQKLEQAAIFLSSAKHFALSDEHVEPSKDFVDALSDDLNTPRAIAILHELLDQAKGRGLAKKIVPGEPVPLMNDEDYLPARQLSANLRLLGINLLEFRDARHVSAAKIDRERISASITARNAARKAKNWAEADRIRDELAAQGIALKDAKDPETGEIVTTWEIAR
jgi:cysteinyl-tRNA synthetase